MEEKVRALLEVTEEQSQRVSRLSFRPHTVHSGSSFYESFALRGIRVDRVEPGLVVCSFKAPSRLADKNGNLSSGAIANLVDELGASVIHVDGRPMDVSVDVSISYISTAKLGISKTVLLVCNYLTFEERDDLQAEFDGGRPTFSASRI